jgi:hypothetical protein
VGSPESDIAEISEAIDICDLRRRLEGFKEGDIHTCI